MKKEPRNTIELIKRLREEGVPENYFSSYVNTYRQLKARAACVPLQGVFELTPLCSLNCKMCYVHLSKDQLQGRNLMTPDQWKTIMKQAISAGMTNATLTGGECLMYPGFQELYLFLHDMGIEVTVFSNGELLDENYVSFFVRHPPKRIQISLYGSCDDAYEKVTGKRCFHRVLENIRRIAAADLPITIAITPSRYMRGDIENVIRLADSLNIVYRVNSHINEEHRELPSESRLDITPEEYYAIYELEKELKSKKASTAPKSGTSAEKKPVRFEDIFDMRSFVQEGLRCGSGRSVFSISFDGMMHPCVSLWEVSEDPGTLGFEAAWHRLNEFARSFSWPPIGCSGCRHEHKCMICPKHYTANVLNGEIHTNPEVCRKMELYFPKP